MGEADTIYRPGDLLRIKGELKKVKTASSLSIRFESDKRSYHPNAENIIPELITEGILMEGFKLLHSRSHPCSLADMSHDYF